MRVFDASSIVYGWDNYPILQFPPLWNWIATQIENDEIVMSKVGFDEVADVAPACATWLINENIRRIEVANAILNEAVRVKNLLGVQSDDYHPNGVGEND